MGEAKVAKEGEIQDGEIWFNRRGNILTLGLTNRAIDDVGDVEDVSFPEEGDQFEQGDAMVAVDGNKGSIELAAPGKGVILEINSAAKDPEIVSSDPLDEGWLVKYQVEDLEELRYLIADGSAASSARDDEEEESDDEFEELDEDEEEEEEVDE